MSKERAGDKMELALSIADLAVHSTRRALEAAATQCDEMAAAWVRESQKHPDESETRRYALAAAVSAGACSKAITEMLTEMEPKLRAGLLAKVRSLFN